MIFNSTVFFVFFIIVFILYWLFHQKKNAQNIIMLVSSLVFYGWWDWRFLSLIFISSFIGYFCGLKIEQSNKQRTRKNWMVVSVVTNLTILGFFKYFNFFAESLVEFTGMFGWHPGNVTLDIILPVGISFYTFQTLSYTIDIYRKEFKATQSFLNFFTYVAFFPQLVAGPIERAAELLPQIEKPRVFNKIWFKEGLVQIFIGLFRKVVIADNLAKYVDVVYGNPEYHNSSTLVIATVFYAFQIYFDFSGYSDIAIGTAKTIGFKFSKNFHLPYFSPTLTVFWRKWHISLSSWLKDYLYISLGGNRKGIKIQYRNLLITMLLGGLWHGSSWNFIIWGGIHGLILSVEKYLFSKNGFSFMKSKAYAVPGAIITFGLVCFAWIFFRAPTFSEAQTIITRIFAFDFQRPFMNDVNIMSNILVALFLGLAVDCFLQWKKIDLEELGRRYSTLQICIFIGIVTALISLLYSTSNNFIYFQF